MSADVESTSSSVRPFKSPLEQKVERIQQAIVKANGNANFYGQSIPPENPKPNDLWLNQMEQLLICTFIMKGWRTRLDIERCTTYLVKKSKKPVESAQQDIDRNSKPNR